MAPEHPRSVTASAGRFLLAGGANTLITGALLSALARLMDPRVAYSLVFTLGVVFAVWTAGSFVFGVRMTRRLAVLYTAMYLAVYLVGLGLLGAAVSAGMPDVWSGAIVLVTAPLTFLGGRLLMTRAAARRATERTP